MWLYGGQLVSDEEDSDSKLPLAQAAYLNDFIERNRYSKGELARSLGMDPSSLSRILNRTAGVGMDKYLGLLRLLGLRVQIVPDGAQDDFHQLGEDMRRALFDWSVTIEELRKRYGEKGPEQAERLATRAKQPVRSRGRPRRKKAEGAEGS